MSALLSHLVRVLYSGGLNSKFDLTLECKNDVKLPYVLLGGEKKTKGKQTDFQMVLSEKRLQVLSFESHRILL